MSYPSRLQEIIAFFEGLSDQEKRENLIDYADQASDHEPAQGESYVLEDVRKDEECTDTVGIFLCMDAGGAVVFRVSLGPQVQTLTRAMTAILCDGLNHSTAETITQVPADFVPKIVGGQLLRVRSQTIYYVLGRMKGACQAYLRRQRAVRP